MHKIRTNEHYIVSVADLTQKIVVLCIRSASKCWGLAGSTHFGICRSKMMNFARNVSSNLTHKGKMLTS